MDLQSVLRQGDRRKSLEALREKLAAELDQAVGRDIAAIAKELRNVVDAIDAIPISREESVVDQLADEVAAQRAKRKAGGRQNAKGV